MLPKKNLRYVFILLVVMIMSFQVVYRIRSTPYPKGLDSYIYINYLKNFLDFGPVSSSNNFIFFMIPYALSILNILLIYMIYETVKGKEASFYGTLSLTLSPVFLETHTTFNALPLSIFLLSLGIFLLLKDKILFGSIFLIFSILTNQNVFFIIFLIIFAVYEKLKSKSFFMPILGYSTLTILFSFINKTSSFESISDYFGFLIFDISGYKTISIFTLFVGFISIFSTWNRKEKYSSFYMILISLFIGSYFDSDLILYIQILLSFFIGIYIKNLIKTKWASETLKEYVIILIVCGIIFSAGSSIRLDEKESPTKEEIMSLVWLKNNMNNSEGIFSLPEYGFLIQNFDFNTYTDKNYEKNSLEKKRINQTNEILNSVDIRTITSFFEKNSLGYVWINKEIKQSVWQSDERGLLLILDNEIKFTKIYDTENIEIWKLNHN